jgi:alanyl-tRNA synthetase
MSPDDAIAAGAMALFGEKYGDEVRVLSMGRLYDGGDVGGGTYSVELCGGTHVRALGDIGLLKIVSEGAVASGVRRIEGLTGEAARLWLADRDEKLRVTASTLRTTPDEVPARVAALFEQNRKLERELADAKRALAMAGSGTGGAGGGNGVAEPEAVGDTRFVGRVIDGLDPKALRGLVDETKAQLGSGVAALVAVSDGRATIAVGVTEDLLGRYSAVDLVRTGVETVGGKGGGGRPDMAQGGGPDGAKASAAIDAVRALLAG